MLCSTNYRPLVCVQISDGKKYYLKYLSAIASTSKIQHHISDGTSVCNAQTECMASNISFKAWKYKQQEKLERWVNVGSYSSKIILYLFMQERSN